MMANENNISSENAASKTRRNAGFFDWSGFDEEKFNKAKEEYKENFKEWTEYECCWNDDEATPSWDDYDGTVAEDYEGAVRIGNLCFDIVSVFDSQRREIFGFNLYVGGVDTGYGYTHKDDYPYDEVNIGEFDSTWLGMGYDEFKAFAEKEFNNCINESSKFYREADLIKKANEPLHIW